MAKMEDGFVSYVHFPPGVEIWEIEVPTAMNDPQTAIDTLSCRVAQLETAIRKLRDSWVRGDDKCWKDIEELCKVLPEGFAVPVRDTNVELDLCRQYIASCHHPGVAYTSPQRKIEELQAKIDQLQRAIGVCVPSALRVLLRLLPPDADGDRELIEKVYQRVEKAMEDWCGDTESHST